MPAGASPALASRSWNAMESEDLQAESIHDWLLRYIKQLTMVESLEWIASQMKADGADGYRYTKDNEQMTRIRQAWGEQMKLARQEQAQIEAAIETDGRLLPSVVGSIVG